MAEGPSMRPSRVEPHPRAAGGGRGRRGWRGGRRLRIAGDLRHGRHRERDGQREQMTGPAKPDEINGAHGSPYSLYTNVGSRLAPARYGLVSEIKNMIMQRARRERVGRTFLHTIANAARRDLIPDHHHLFERAASDCR